MSVIFCKTDNIDTKDALDDQQDFLQDFSIMGDYSIKKRHCEVSALAVNAISLAYGINRDSFALKDSTINGALLADTYWKVLNLSHDSEETNQCGFKAVTFINHHTHEIHIASAGTVIDRHDIQDDLLIAQGSAPSKLKSLKALVDTVIQSIGGSSVAEVYRFSTSGHSLGAVVADLTGLEIASRGLPLVSSTTFENPGSESAIQAVLNNQGFSGKLNSEHLTKLRQRCTVYNARPNLINTTQPQFADHCNLVLPRSDEKSTKMPQINSNHGLWSFGQYLCGMVGSAVNTCASYLGLNHLKQLKEDHGLQNFQALEESAVIPVSYWHSGWNWDAPLLANAVSPELLKVFSTHSPNGNELFFEEEDKDFSLVKIQGVNFRDVKGALKQHMAASCCYNLVETGSTDRSGWHNPHDSYPAIVACR